MRDIPGHNKPWWMKTTGGGLIQTLILMRRRPRIRSCSEAASSTLPGFYFISVMETQHSSLLFWSRNRSSRIAGWKSWHLNTKTFWHCSGAETLRTCHTPRLIQTLRPQTSLNVLRSIEQVQSAVLAGIYNKEGMTSSAQHVKVRTCVIFDNKW